MELPNTLAADQACAELAISLVAYSLGIPGSAIVERGRGARVSLARKIAMYLTHVGFGMSMARVAVVFGRDRSTVSSACRQMEDRRDEIGFDRWLGALERSTLEAPMPYVRNAA